MSHHDVGNDRTPVESETIERVIGALSEPVTVRAAFRAELLAAIDHDMPRPRRLMPARWSLRPVAAMAAAVGCMMVGATAAALLIGRWHGTPRASDVPGDVASTMPSSAHATVSIVRFVLVAPNARRVSVVGDFNRWNPAAMPMRRSPDGRAWLLDIPLAPGRHVYSFSVDGDLAPDPAAPESGDDDFGVPSSVVLVGGKA
jgi:predicted carbohydrate-binding protein with CBM48